jgi:primosomal protein N' (replication factor Y) (superfamily II helicase)
MVPFGNRQVVGLVVEVAEQVQTEFEIKSVEKVVRESSRIPTELLELINWCCRYYHAVPWDLISAFLPSRVQAGKSPRMVTRWQINAEASAQISAKAKRQKQLFEWLSEKGASEELAISEAGFSKALLAQLKKAGAVEPSYVDPKSQHIREDIDLIEPTADQAEVLTKIDKEGATTFLLEGITGSGKTLIYLHLAQKLLAQGKQVLILVPEIGLVPQMVTQFEALVAEPVSYHSGLTDSRRAEIWHDCLKGRSLIVIGTRSSLFLPFKNLGLIVVDEEHDHSYKQQEGPRYQARDVAVVRASNLKIPIVLGSATPSLESIENANQGSFQRLELKQRVGDGALPAWKLLEGVASSEDAGLLPDSLMAIREQLKLGNQVLIFINRRGYSPCLRCSQCGWQARCDQCDSRYTYHKAANQLRCHRCDLQHPTPMECPVCASRQLSFLGQGTERIAQKLAEIFSEVPLIRIDRDATRGKDGIQRKLDEVHASGPAILVGTQMLAKGHHFPRLALALILDIDYGLMSSDFRASEHLVQLLTQIAGRTGRSSIEGQVLLQTEFPGHPVLQDLITHNYSHFANELLQTRRQWSLPPCTFMAVLRTESEDISMSQKLLSELVQVAENSELDDCEIIGPVPSPTEKRNGRYRFQLQISSATRSKLHEQLSVLVAYLDQRRLNKNLRWHLDVDPASLD